MIVGHSLPDPAWSIASSHLSGAAIISPASALSDRRPDTPTRMQWMTGTPDSAHKLYLRGDWSPAFVPRIVGILNPSLPADLLVTVSFRRPSDTFGTYPYQPTMLQVGGQRIVVGPRGEKTCWLLVAPGASPVSGVQFEIWNNVGGVTAITSAEQFTVGEALVCPAEDVEIEAGWSFEYIDPTTTQFDPWRQPYAQPGTPYRRLTWQLMPELQSDVFGTAGRARARLKARIDRGQTCVYIPRSTLNGTFDTDMLHGTAMLGIATNLSGFTHAAGPYFNDGRNVVTEVPIPT